MVKCSRHVQPAEADDVAIATAAAFRFNFWPAVSTLLPRYLSASQAALGSFRACDVRTSSSSLLRRPLAIAEASLHCFVGLVVSGFSIPSVFALLYSTLRHRRLYRAQLTIHTTCASTYWHTDSDT